MMETAQCKKEIKNTFSNLRKMSFNEKHSPLLQEKEINILLDTIIDLKKLLTDKSQSICDINNRMEKLTWFDNIDNECLMLINDLISTAKDLRSTLIRQYVSMNVLRSKGIAKEEIKEFKNALDDLKEVYEDLESVFFYLPQMPDFVETTKRLSLV